MKDCATGKISYPTKGRATRSAKSFKKFTDLHLLSSYNCPVCGNWHLGHAPGSGYKQKLQRIHKQFRAPRWRENTTDLEALTEGG